MHTRICHLLVTNKDNMDLITDMFVEAAKFREPGFEDEERKKDYFKK